jgi:hypothetical protein
MLRAQNCPPEAEAQGGEGLQFEVEVRHGRHHAA